jgi:hypothetical protein
MAVNNQNNNRISSKLNKQHIAAKRMTRRSQGVSMKVFQDFNQNDVVESDVAKGVTSAMFTDDADSTLTSFFTSSVQKASDGGKYQLEVYSANPNPEGTGTPVPQFSIAFGEFDGKGANKNAGASSSIKTSTKAVYTQFANLLLDPGDDKFTINGTDRDEMIFITMNRARYKEKMNKGGWELSFCKSNETSFASAAASEKVILVDDSATVTSASANGALVYNIIEKGTTTKIGLFYPELGILAMSGTLVKAQCGGAVGSTYADPVIDSDQLINLGVYAMILKGANFKARAEEDISSTHYFIRVRNAEYNFSNNNTFTTGSGVMAHATMVRDPQVYITTVGLYNDENELVAVSKLSKPLLKNFTREATIRVKLDY